MDQQYPRQGFKAKTVKAVIAKKLNQWFLTIADESVRKLAQEHTIVTGGCIASMLLGEKINDFDIYFSNRETVIAIAKYYVDQFNSSHGKQLSVGDDGTRIRILTENGHRSETAGDITTIQDPGHIEDAYEEAEQKALQTEDEIPDYRPVFMSTNAITLSNKIQLVLRFYGSPDTIHENYDFVHCTNYFTSKDGHLELRPKALESLLSRELRYVGSKYPLCSLIRLRKFIKRHWSVNAGQILKMVMQISELDLTSLAVLEDQLTGVDVAYFLQVIDALKEKDPEKVNAAYLVEIINRMF